MEILQTIWTALTMENDTIIKIISILAMYIEATLSFKVSITSSLFIFPIN